MAQARPHIPENVQRQVLFEAGHRCSACGAELPLERAHIGNLGWAHAELGDLKKAVALLESRIAISRSLSDRRGEAESSWTLGWIYEQLGERARAVELLQVRADYQHAINHPEANETDAEVQALRARIRDTPSFQ